MKLFIKTLSLVLIFSLFSFLLTNCNPTKENSKRTFLIKRADENFDKFYAQFHSDSLFQKSRIKFPLQGTSSNGIEEMAWTMDNYPKLKVPVYEVDTTKYKVLYKKTEKVFTQKFWVEDSGFSSECRFELINRKWYLVYVIDQNL